MKNPTKIIKNRIVKINKLTEEYQKNINNSRLIADYTSLLKQKLKLNEDYFFIESYGGKALSISILNIIRGIVARNSRANIFVSNINYFDFESLLSENELKKITFIKKNSLPYLRALVMSKTIITDYYLPTYFQSVATQKVINTGEAFIGFWINDISETEKIIQHTLLHTTHFLFDSVMPETVLRRLKVGGIKEYYYRFYSEESIKFDDKEQEETLLLVPRDSKFKSITILDDFIDQNMKNEQFYIMVHPEDEKIYQQSNFYKHIRILDSVNEGILRAATKVYSESELLLERSIFKNASKVKIDSFGMEISLEEKIVSDKISIFNGGWNKTAVDKKNIVVYAGGFANNGVTASAINLSHNIDYKKYNFIFLDKLTYDADSSLNLKKVNQNANIIYRSGQMNLEVYERIIASQVQGGKGISEVLRKKDAEKIFYRESCRIMGNINLDAAVDFSGYVVFWTAVIAFSKANKKSIFQHNDLKAETEKIINGVYKHKDKLPRVFQLYKYYDEIISVGKKTLELNRENLKKYAPRDKFKYIPNSLNLDEISQKSNNLGNLSMVEEEKHYALCIDESSNIVQKIRIPNPKEYTLINIGRMSPEKDQKKLINAFHRALPDLPQNTKLFILGDGILKKELEQQVKGLSLEEKVIFTGQVQNPFYYLKNSNGFILTSNHEGQPMVLLECLALNVPIIATDIAGNSSVLGDILPQSLVDNDEVSISNKIVSQYQTMESSECGYDITTYNKHAMDKFYKYVIGENF